MKNIWKIKMAVFGLVAVAAMGAVVMWLWNWLIPTLFHGPEIDYFQTLGLMLLSRILFRGFIGKPNAPCSNFQKNQWKGKWSTLSTEEKDKMRDLWKKRCVKFDCSDELSEEKDEPEAK